MFCFRLETRASEESEQSYGGYYSVVCLWALWWSIICDEPMHSLGQETVDEAKKNPITPLNWYDNENKW